MVAGVRVLPPAQKVRILLATLDEVLDGYGEDSTGAGVRRMPGIYARHSYPELERRLSELRDNERRLWWHASQRYRYGRVQWAKIRLERRNGNVLYKPPPRTEVVAVGEASGTWVSARVYTWTEAVDPVLAEAALDRLTETMYDGDTTRIWIPDVFMGR